MILIQNMRMEKNLIEIDFDDFGADRITAKLSKKLFKIKPT